MIKQFALLLAAAYLVVLPCSHGLDLSLKTLFKMFKDVPCQAYEVHLAFGNSVDTMSLSWRTDSSTCESCVRYGLARDNTVAETATGTSFLITENQMCQAPATSTPFTVVMHEVHLKFEEGEAKYWYQIGDDPTIRYLVSPKRADTKQDITFVLFGDLGQNRMAEKTMSQIEESHLLDPADFVIHMGDLAYADGNYRKWDNFMRIIEPTSSQVAYMVGVGNHEYDYTDNSDQDPSGVMPYRPSWGDFDVDQSGGECGAMTSLRFRMPRKDATDNPPFWYSFEYGPIHFVVVSTEHDISPGSVQHDWLEKHLASVDRCRTPWLVVGHHRPFYVVYPHHDNRLIGEHLKDFLEGMFIRYKVDLTVSGHVHSYYRSCAVNDYVCDKKSGVTHIVIGTGGYQLSPVTDEQDSWVRAAHVEFGFGVFTLDQDRNLLRFKFVSDRDGSVVDEATISPKITRDNCLKKGNL